MHKQTIYWWRPPVIPATLFNVALLDCQKICQIMQAKNMFQLCGPDSDVPAFESEKIAFSGVPTADLFLLPQKSTRLNRDGQVFEFCKTNRLPYELAAVACVVIFKFYLEDRFHISTDRGIDCWPTIVSEFSDVFGWADALNLSFIS